MSNIYPRVDDVHAVMEREWNMKNRIKIEYNNSTTAFNKNLAIEIESEDLSTEELNKLAMADIEVLDDWK